MGYEYLESLPISDEEKQKIRSLGARTPTALLSLMEHAFDKFAMFFGKEQAEQIRGALEKLVSQEEKDRLASLPPFRGKYGASIVSTKSEADLAESKTRVDNLMRQIRFLRESGDSSPETQQTIAKLEADLRDELKSAAAR